MWTGEIREWYILQGEMTGRIYGSRNCLWSNWEYPDGTFISISIYHFPDSGRIKYLSNQDRNGTDLVGESISNYMRLTRGAVWYWDVRQTHRWNPCPLHFKLIINDYKPPWNYRSWNYHYTKPSENSFMKYKTNRFILKSGCMVSRCQS